MEIKRYAYMWGDETKGESDGLKHHPKGEWYHRADLIAAGCLVPVPDGEAKTNIGTQRWQRVLYDGEVWIASNIPYELERVRDNERIDPGPDAIVQPVRLVRLEDVE